MNALRTIQVAKNNRLIIDVPKEFDNKTCEVIVLNEASENSSEQRPKKSRYEIAKEFMGMGAGSSYLVNEDDVYDQ